MQSLGKQVRHVFSHPECEDITSSDKLKPFRHREFINNIHRYLPHHFPLIDNKIEKNEISLDNLKEKMEGRELYSSLPKMSFKMAPEKNRQVLMDFSGASKSTPTPEKYPAFLELHNKLYNSYREKKSTGKFSFSDKPNITFYGTGSMMPAIYRNVSCIGLEFEGCNMLLDCGEGTFGQLADRLQKKELKEYLKKLKVIYITHIHLDHNLGMFQVLEERIRFSESSESSFEVIILFFI